jgi:hypothetical protein
MPFDFDWCESQASREVGAWRFVLFKKFYVEPALKKYR